MSPIEEKTKILAWGDYGCSTGFATVMSNIMMGLEKTGEFDITVLGINYNGDPINKERFPGVVWPARNANVDSSNPLYGDFFGRQRLLDLAGSGEFDVLFLLQDTFILQDVMEPLLKTQTELAKDGGKSFKIVYYFPIDAEPKPEWVSEVVAKVDFPVVYTKYGANEVARYDSSIKLPYIYHGTNIDDFYYVEDRNAVEKFRTHWFKGLADDRFLIMNVNRNQPRKDIARSLMILAELKARGHNPLMYMHMQHSDVGGNIFVMAQQLGLENEVDLVAPNPSVFNANAGVSVESLNMLYNSADCILTSTLGEGWGLSITEAMATKTAVVGPDNTSLTEMMADNRGLLVPSGDNPSAHIVMTNDLERIRPLMNVEKAADAIEELMHNKSKVDIEGAYTWARQHSWENIVNEQWLPIIREAAKAAKSRGLNRQQRRALERKKQ